ncbi:MAG: hypothetical protein HEQ32_08245 [Vampirovibrio sp.]
MAFKCSQCQSTEFTVALSAGATMTLTWYYNEAEDLVFILGKDNPSFVADLGFMNRFASCKQCRASHSWGYFFQNTVPTPPKKIKV